MKRPLRVSLIQSPAWDLDQHEQAWADLLTRIDDAGGEGTDLIVTPEASYPAYVLHSRERYEAAQLLPDDTVEAALGALASSHRCHIVSGLIQRDEQGALRNRAVLFGPDGAVLGRYDKSFLWHIDRDVFAPGDAFPTFPAALGSGPPLPLGAYICADGRLPEIPRTLAAAGARLLAVPTAWVASGPDPARLISPQAEFLAQARAVENGVWVLVADKVGVEDDSLIYAGRSGIIAPDGSWLVQAPSDAPGVVTATIDLDPELGGGPPVRPRPELYGPAHADGATSTGRRHAEEPIVVAKSAARVATAALAPEPSAVDLMEQIRRAALTQAEQGAQLLVLPDLAGSDPSAVTADELLPALGQIARETVMLLTVVLAERASGVTYKTCYAVGPDGVRAAHRQTHLLPAELAAGFRPGDQPCPRVPSAAGTVGLLAGAEGLVPELGRAHKLAGAEILAWSAGPLPAPLRVLARARANEQRLYVVAAGDGGNDGYGNAGYGNAGYIATPEGTVAQESLPGRAMSVSADINRALARWHRMAPGTDPIEAWRPAADFSGAPPTAPEG